MATFQKFVLYGAIAVLIVALVFVGVALTYANDKQQWPPVTPQCPDYWTIDGSGNDAKCVNTKNLGTCPAPTGEKHLTMNFQVAPFVGTNELCAKYAWAKKCDVSWDGITYGVPNPCQQSI